MVMEGDGPANNGGELLIDPLDPPRGEEWRIILRFHPRGSGGSRVDGHQHGRAIFYSLIQGYASVLGSMENCAA